jgi:hypothetical protein
MIEDKSNWYYHEFRVYLLLYAAHADFEMNPTERQKIRSKATDKEYRHICKVFDNDSDYERIETIQSYREKFYPTPEFAEKLMKEIAALLDADEDENLYERNFYRMMRKLLVK